MTDDFFPQPAGPDDRFASPASGAGQPHALARDRGIAWLAQRWARQIKAGKKIEGLDLFGPVYAMLAGDAFNAGRPRLPTRLMVALLYLKHAFNESDEDVIQRWGETPTWQYFTSNEYFEHQWPCDPTQLRRFSKALGEEGVEELLARTMATTRTAMRPAHLPLARPGQKL